MTKLYIVIFITFLISIYGYISFIIQNIYLHLCFLTFFSWSELAKHIILMDFYKKLALDITY